MCVGSGLGRVDDQVVKTGAVILPTAALVAEPRIVLGGLARSCGPASGADSPGVRYSVLMATSSEETIRRLDELMDSLDEDQAERDRLKKRADSSLQELHELTRELERDLANGRPNGARGRTDR